MALATDTALKCSQKFRPCDAMPEEECEDPVAFLVHWPGDDILCCAIHAAGWANIARAMGFKLSIDVIGSDPPITIWTPDPPKPTDT